jgi:hypothetical protein
VLKIDLPSVPKPATAKLLSNAIRTCTQLEELYLASHALDVKHVLLQLLLDVCGASDRLQEIRLRIFTSDTLPECASI